MAKLAKKLYYRKSSTAYPIDLFDSTANVGSNYITLRVDGGLAYAQIAPVGTPGNSSLRVRKSSTIYAVNSTVQDSTLITTGGSVVDNGSCFVPNVPTGTFAGGGSADPGPAAATWSSAVSWSAINTMLCMFTVSYQAHISGVGVDHYRLKYGLTTACTVDGGVFSGTSRTTPELATGTYYFRVDAEDASNNVLYSSAVYGGVANTYNTGNSTGNITLLRSNSGGAYPVNTTVEFTTTTTWVVPAGVTYIVVHGIGGGGGGSGKSMCYRPTAGGGGGSGWFLVDQVIGVTPGETLTITIGTGGYAGYDEWYGSQPDRWGGRGGNGGDTTLHRGATLLLSCTGGKGSCYNVADGTGTYGSASGQDHSWAGRGSLGGVSGTQGYGGSGSPDYPRFWTGTVWGGTGGVAPAFGYYGAGGNGATGTWTNAPNTAATAGKPGKLIIEYLNASTTLAISATSSAPSLGNNPARRYFAAKTYTTQGYGDKTKTSSYACADTCSCNCNYCTCNCNYCTCNCNYCTCNCNYTPCSCSSGN